MALPIFMNRILSHMHQFQKDNEITKECITNVQYYYDIMNTKGFNVKAKPVVALYSKLNGNEHTTITVIHMVIEYENGIILDPSYEISSIKNCQYCDSIKVLIELLSTYPTPLTKEYIASILTQFIKFKKIADDINLDKFIICNKDFYHNQHAYIESL